MVDSTEQLDIFPSKDLHKNFVVAGEFAHKVQPIQIPSEKISTDFCQDEQTLTLFVYIKTVIEKCLRINVREADVTLEFKLSDRSTLPAGYGDSDSDATYIWTIRLKHPVHKDFTYKLGSMKIEILLKKQKPELWDGLKPSPAIPSTTFETLSVSNLAASMADPLVGNYLDKMSLRRQNNPRKALMSDSELKSMLPDLPNNVWLPVNHDSDAIDQVCDRVFNRLNNAPKQDLAFTPFSNNNVSNNGFVGLDNLGNTCFMNSVLQCLSNTEELRDYFISQHFKEDININNALGTGGKLANCFYQLLCDLWSGNRRSIAPSTLKTLIGDKVSQFSGFSQHDAQEYIVYLLDTLHEDVNRIKKKPYIDMNNDDKSLSDEELANDAWHKYRMRNDSVIIDLFYGQYKSKLTCPKCPKTSVTFDPFLFLPVPIPKNRSLYQVFLFRRAESGAKKPEKRLVRLHNNCHMTDLYDALSAATGINSSCFQAIVVSDHPPNEIKNLVLPSSMLPSDKDIILVFETLDHLLYDENSYCEFIVQQRLITSSSSLVCNVCKKSIVNRAKRCNECFKFLHCSEECQKSDTNHCNECTYTTIPVGCPFIISLPRSQLTYANLCQQIIYYSKNSVDVSPCQEMTKTFGTSTMEKIATIDCGRDSDSGIFSDSVENGNFSSHAQVSSNALNQSASPSSSTSSSSSTSPSVLSSVSSSVASSPGSSEPPFFIRFHPTPSSFTATKENLLTEPDDVNEELTELAEELFLTVEWRSDRNIVETKELDFNLDILAAKKASDSDDYSLEDCISLFSKPEVLSAREAWYCPDCKAHRQATKRLALWRLPQILIIQLKRFHFVNHMFRHKINDLVKFPIRGLDLTEYVCRSALSPGPKPIYDLYAVVNHYGDMFKGHYTACARTRYGGRDVGWRKFNDCVVSKIDEDYVVTSEAYILFYRLRDDNESIDGDENGGEDNFF